MLSMLDCFSQGEPRPRWSTMTEGPPLEPRCPQKLWLTTSSLSCSARSAEGGSFMPSTTWQQCAPALLHCTILKRRQTDRDREAQCVIGRVEKNGIEKDKERKLNFSIRKYFKLLHPVKRDQRSMQQQQQQRGSLTIDPDANKTKSGSFSSLCESQLFAKMKQRYVSRRLKLLSSNVEIKSFIMLFSFCHRLWTMHNWTQWKHLANNW